MRLITELEKQQALYTFDDIVPYFIGRYLLNDVTIRLIKAELEQMCLILHEKDPNFPKIEWHLEMEMKANRKGDEFPTGRLMANPIKINGEDVTDDPSKLEGIG